MIGERVAPEVPVYTPGTRPKIRLTPQASRTNNFPALPKKLNWLVSFPFRDDQFDGSGVADVSHGIVPEYD